MGVVPSQLCSGRHEDGTVPLADFVGEPVAVGGVEALAAGGDAAPVECGGLGGTGCTVLLSQTCGDMGEYRWYA